MKYYTCDIVIYRHLSEMNKEKKKNTHWGNSCGGEGGAKENL